MAQRIPIDPDKGLPDLVRQLGDDSKRLVRDEIRLAKLESSESLQRATRGGLWLALAFGVAIVALVAFTLLGATLFGRIAEGHYWVGALLIAAVDVALGLWLLRAGLRALKDAPYTLPETRTGLKILKG